MSKIDIAIKKVRSTIKDCVVFDAVEVADGVVISCEGAQPLLWDEKARKLRGLNGNIKADAEIIRSAERKSNAGRNRDRGNARQQQNRRNKRGNT